MRNKIFQIRKELKDLYFEIDNFLYKDYDLGYVQYFLEKIKNKILEMEDKIYEN